MRCRDLLQDYIDADGKLNKDNFRFCKSHPYSDDLKPDRFIALTYFKNDEELVALFNVLLYKIKRRKREYHFL